MSHLRLDLAVAVRTLLRRPGFAIVAVATIGLAIAANAAIFSIVNGVLLRPLPFRDPERQVTIDARASTSFLVSTSIPNYRDWRDRSRVFESFAGWAGWGHTLTGRGPATTVESSLVLGDLFGTLGIAPAVGRLFTADEAAAHGGGSSLAVVSHAFWVDRLGRDPAVVGQTLVLDERPYAVIGVLPPGVGFPSPEVEVYLPMSATADLPWDDRHSGFGTRSVARLAPGVTLAAARLDLERVGQEVRRLAGTAAVAMPELRAGLPAHRGRHRHRGVGRDRPHSTAAPIALRGRPARFGDLRGWRRRLGGGRDARRAGAGATRPPGGSGDGARRRSVSGRLEAKPSSSNDFAAVGRGSRRHSRTMRIGRPGNTPGTSAPSRTTKAPPTRTWRIPAEG